jgi:hypothetical protein
MRRLTAVALLLAAVVALACDATTPGPTTTAGTSTPPASTPPASTPPASTPSTSPAPTATLDTSIFQPLPEILAGIPLGGGPSAEIAPESAANVEPDPAVGHAYELGHCGLLQPVDFDGSLWVPSGGHNGVGAPLTQDQVGELINASQVRLFLLDEQHLLLVTPMNGFVLLTRHEGAREYALCD